MLRFMFLTTIAVCAFASQSTAQCHRYPYPIYYQPQLIYVPVYPIQSYPSSIWGAPAPKPLPPAPPPYVPPKPAV
jgi:hypothetical protein